jgi:F0F1-type ATP synthase membrane subunit c/vacuolar-type H+-ATPase subunit K
MTKPVLGLMLGGVLGVFDGLSALVSAPNDPAIKAGIVGIVIGSTGKGLIAGALIGWYARNPSRSLTSTILVGLAIGLALAFCISLAQVLAGEPPYYWQIMLPGGILGVIVGYATFKAPASTPARAAQSR